MAVCESVMIVIGIKDLSGMKLLNFNVTLNDHDPDAIQIAKCCYSNVLLEASAKNFWQKFNLIPIFVVKAKPVGRAVEANEIPKWSW